MDRGFAYPCDSIYVAPWTEEIGLACAGRLVWERQRGLRILVVALFGDAAPRGVRRAARRLPPALAEGVRHLSLGLTPSSKDVPEAPNDRRLAAAAERLAGVLHATRARHLYAPLAVRAHVDHRLCHLAALDACQVGEGRSIFLFEERPEALVGGAVRIRLAQLGARLPPAAEEAAERARLPRYLWGVNVPTAFRGELAGWGARLRSLRGAARLWRASRAWHPLRALGPRMQPVVYATPSEYLDEVRALIGPLGRRVQAWADAYAGRLYASTAMNPAAAHRAGIAEATRRSPSGALHAERYWLLLSPREASAIETVTPVA